MSDRHPASVVVPAVVAALVLLAIYFGAYYWFVIPVDLELAPAGGGFLIVRLPYFMLSQEDEQWNVRLTSFFTLAFWMDERIRPHVWGPTP